MKKIFYRLFLIALVTGLVGSATYAWFTDQAVVTGSLASGKLNVELRGPAASGITVALDTTQYFKGGLAPGVPTQRYEVAVYNLGNGQSTLPVKYSWTNAFTSGDSALFDMLNVKVEDGNCDWVTNWPAGLTSIYNGKLKDMGRVIPAVTLDPNITRCTWFTFELDSTADNSLQGKSAQFNLTLDATQPENTTWAE